jgi:phosphoribosylformimino-5-aminoimidazole carboxamide ribotide isomerase
VLPQENAFEVIPAIDVLDRRVVRLSQGRRAAVTIEGGDPIALAQRYAAEKATRLHLVDLNGAFEGEPSLKLVRDVAAVGVPVQVGGGYRTLDTIASAFEAGADRVLVGTAALSRGFLEEAVARFEEGIAVAVDIRDGSVSVDGWTRSSRVTPEQLAEQCVRAGAARLLVTAANRDGSLAGPDLSLLERIVPFGLPVLAAGGIAEISDVVAIRDLGCEGAIAGSALLQGRFTLHEARAATVGR